MKNISTGFGLCIVGLGIAAWPVLDRLMPQANAISVGSVAPAVAAAALAQDPPAPTIVWYGADSGYVLRAWSSGRLEAMMLGAFDTPGCGGYPTNVEFQVRTCPSVWQVIYDPDQGYNSAADLNFDQAVDGVDLGMMLAKWGPAPRNPVPPSGCPLALINP